MTKKDVLTYLTIIIITITVVATSGYGQEEGFMPSRGVDYERARVQSVNEEVLTEDPSLHNVFYGSQQLEVELLSGPFQGQKFSIYNSVGRGHNVVAEEGMTIIVSLVERDGKVDSITVFQYQRRIGIYLLGAVLIGVLVLVGRRKGLMSILSLIFTGILLLFFLIPALIRGAQPIPVGIATAILSISVNFYLLNGWSKKTFAGIIGTSIGLVIAGIMAYLAGRIGNMSGIHTTNADELTLIAEGTGLRLRGLLFVTILISAMGAVMDVGMSIASATFELKLNNPSIKKHELFTSGMNVGRDIIGTMTNTLILVFIGGMLSVIMISVAYGKPFTHFINHDLAAVEISQALAGSIGLVLTVPITALIAGHLYSRME